MSRPDRSKGKNGGMDGRTNPARRGSAEGVDVDGKQPQRRRPITLTIIDERLSDIYQQMLCSDEVLPVITTENPNDRKVIYLHPVEVFDPTLQAILPQRPFAGPDRRRSSPADGLRAFAVKVVLWTFVISVVCLLAIALCLAVGSKDVVVAATALGKILESEAGFLKVVFGGSLLALIFGGLFVHRSTRSSARQNEERRSDHDANPDAERE